jgi:hypothetical protein
MMKKILTYDQNYYSFEKRPFNDLILLFLKEIGGKFPTFELIYYNGLEY